MHTSPQASFAKPVAFAILSGLAVVTAMAAISLGSIAIAPSRVLDALFSTSWTTHADMARDSLVITQIRLPRLLLGAAVGAALAVAGAIMQGLFRNPLADPGLIGVSSGAGFAPAVAAVWRC